MSNNIDVEEDHQDVNPLVEFGSNVDQLTMMIENGRVTGSSLVADYYKPIKCDGKTYRTYALFVDVMESINRVEPGEKGDWIRRGAGACGQFANGYLSSRERSVECWQEADHQGNNAKAQQRLEHSEDSGRGIRRGNEPKGGHR